MSGCSVVDCTPLVPERSLAPVPLALNVHEPGGSLPLATTLCSCRLAGGQNGVGVGVGVGVGEGVGAGVGVGEVIVQLKSYAFAIDAPGAPTSIRSVLRSIESPKFAEPSMIVKPASHEAPSKP